MTSPAPHLRPFPFGRAATWVTRLAELLFGPARGEAETRRRWGLRYLMVACILALINRRPPAGCPGESTVLGRGRLRLLSGQPHHWLPSRIRDDVPRLSGSRPASDRHGGRVGPVRPRAARLHDWCDRRDRADARVLLPPGVSSHRAKRRAAPRILRCLRVRARWCRVLCHADEHRVVPRSVARLPVVDATSRQPLAGRCARRRRRDRGLLDPTRRVDEPFLVVACGRRGRASRPKRRGVRCDAPRGGVSGSHDDAHPGSRTVVDLPGYGKVPVGFRWINVWNGIGYTFGA